MKLAVAIVRFENENAGFSPLLLCTVRFGIEPFGP